MEGIDRPALSFFAAWMAREGVELGSLPARSLRQAEADRAFATIDQIIARYAVPARLGPSKVCAEKIPHQFTLQFGHWSAAIWKRSGCFNKLGARTLRHGETRLDFLR